VTSLSTQFTNFLDATKKPSALKIRPIKQNDNPAVAQVIKTVMTEYACVGEGYSIEDPEVEDMWAAYDNDKSAFYVIADEGDKIWGCGGIAPLAGGPADTCELKKMYFYTAARGRGLGREMMELCLQTASEIGYKKCYLETVERMAKANKLYGKYGFKKLTQPEGCTGHGGCDTFYLKELS